MVNFFREHKSARKATLIFIILLFCLGSLFSGGNNSSGSLNIGKRRVNTASLQQTYQALVEQNPGIDPAALQQYLLNLEISKLSTYGHIEALGIRPSSKTIKQAAIRSLPQDTTLSEVSSRMQLSPDTLLLQISDEVAQSQLTNSLSTSNFLTTIDAKHHQQVLSQVREYVDIPLADLTVSDNQPELQALYAAHKEQLLSTPVYHYEYIDITPQVLNFKPINAEQIQSYFESNQGRYVDQNINYQLTEYSSGKPPNTAPVWPEAIQQKVDAYAEHNRRSTHQTKTVTSLLANTNPQHRPHLEKAILETYASFEEGGSLYIIKMNEATPTNTVAHGKSEQLKHDATQQHHSHLMTQAIKSVADYAYMHPHSLSEVADHYGAIVKEVHTQNPIAELTSTLNDPDTLEKHYVSEPVEISPNYYQIIQLKNYEPSHIKDFDDAITELKAIYKREILEPLVSHELASCSSLEEIIQVCLKHKLNYKMMESDISDEQGIQKTSTLIPTINTPKPKTLTHAEDGLHWVQLNQITFNESQEIMLDVVNKIDADNFLRQTSIT